MSGITRQLLVMLLLLVGLVSTGLAQIDPAAPPPRLVNGTLIEGAIQEINAEGIVMQTPKGVQTYPWNHLSTATRYRFERPYLANPAAFKPKPVKKPDAKAPTNAPAKKTDKPPARK